ncbi:nucleotidyltransferase family protein [uncultured Pseudoteredinibacter sp.]|uniref:nucleotidyltransferase family protein n=1 Tax=uncultured Pseudoteredinibacter sp. TaxID=1641701 RepID=UPI0026131656|nr:nucleotidyltransferase family protein [uncultured Pseudoteredinibacter sp.]
MHSSISNLNERLQVCFLAAGFSRRFGSSKLLAPMPDGRKLIEHSLQPYLELGLSPTVFLRADDQALITKLEQYSLPTILLEDVSEGLSVSVRAAAGYAQSKEHPFTLFALADMPYLRARALEIFLSAIDWQENSIFAPFSQELGRLGNPAIFHRNFLTEFNNLHGDQGARPILSANPNDMRKIDCPDTGFYKDVDTREDLTSGSPAGSEP